VLDFGNFVAGSQYPVAWLARADASLRHLLARLSRIEVLVIDYWAMAPLNQSEHREVWKFVRIVTKLAPPFSLPNFPSRTGMNRSEILPSLTVSSTVWSTTPIASKCTASPCEKPQPTQLQSWERSITY
jgi:hypothetical protein